MKPYDYVPVWIAAAALFALAAWSPQERPAPTEPVEAHGSPQDQREPEQAPTVREEPQARPSEPVAGQSPADELRAAVAQARQIVAQLGRLHPDDSAQARMVQGLAAILDRQDAILGVTRTPEPPIGREPPPSSGGTDPVPPGTGGGGGSGDPLPPPVVPPSDPGAGSVTPPAGVWVSLADVGARPVSGMQVLTSAWGFNIGVKKLQTLTDADVSSVSQGGAVTSTSYSGAGPINWTNVTVHPVSAINKTKWGLRGYDIENSRWLGCTFRDVPVEHGAYLNTTGGLAFDHCLFENCGSQAIQVVYATPGGKRAMETGFGANWATHIASTADQWQEVLDTAAIQCGGGARPSYTFSFFGGGPHPVRVARCILTMDKPFTTGTGTYRSTGFFMAHGRSRVELLDTYADYPQGDRDTVQLWRNGDGQPGTVDVRIRGCMILANTFVEIRQQPGDIVVIEGNPLSECEVLISTNVTGIQRNQAEWDASLIQYRAPLSQDATVVVQ